MTDERLLKFLRSVGRTTMIRPYETEDDESIRHFIWLLDVPTADLCSAQDDAILLSLGLYDPDPVPFVIGVADLDKSGFLRAESQASPPSSVAAGAASLSSRLSQSSTSRAQASLPPPAFVLGSSNAPRSPNFIAGPGTASNCELGHAY